MQRDMSEKTVSENKTEVPVLLPPKNVADEWQSKDEKDELPTLQSILYNCQDISHKSAEDAKEKQVVLKGNSDLVRDTGPSNTSSTHKRCYGFQMQPFKVTEEIVDMTRQLLNKMSYPIVLRDFWMQIISEVRPGAASRGKIKNKRCFYRIQRILRNDPHIGSLLVEFRKKPESKREEILKEQSKMELDVADDFPNAGKSFEQNDVCEHFDSCSSSACDKLSEEAIVDVTQKDTELSNCAHVENFISGPTQRHFSLDFKVDDTVVDTVEKYLMKQRKQDVPWDLWIKVFQDLGYEVSCSAFDDRQHPLRKMYAQCVKHHRIQSLFAKYAYKNKNGEKTDPKLSGNSSESVCTIKEKIPGKTSDNDPSFEKNASEVNLNSAQFSKEAASTSEISVPTSSLQPTLFPFPVEKRKRGRPPKNKKELLSDYPSASELADPSGDQKEKKVLISSGYYCQLCKCDTGNIEMTLRHHYSPLHKTHKAQSKSVAVDQDPVEKLLNVLAKQYQDQRNLSNVAEIDLGAADAIEESNDDAPNVPGDSQEYSQRRCCLQVLNRIIESVQENVVKGYNPLILKPFWKLVFEDVVPGYMYSPCKKTQVGKDCSDIASLSANEEPASVIFLPKEKDSTELHSYHARYKNANQGVGPGNSQHVTSSKNTTKDGTLERSSDESRDLDILGYGEKIQDNVGTADSMLQEGSSADNLESSFIFINEDSKLPCNFVSNEVVIDNDPNFFSDVYLNKSTEIKASSVKNISETTFEVSVPEELQNEDGIKKSENQSKVSFSEFSELNLEKDEAPPVKRCKNELVKVEIQVPSDKCITVLKPDKIPTANSSAKEDSSSEASQTLELQNTVQVVYPLVSIKKEVDTGKNPSETSLHKDTIEKSFIKHHENVSTDRYQDEISSKLRQEVEEPRPVGFPHAQHIQQSAEKRFSNVNSCSNSKFFGNGSVKKYPVCSTGTAQMTFKDKIKYPSLSNDASIKQTPVANTAKKKLATSTPIPYNGPELPVINIKTIKDPVTKKLKRNFYFNVTNSVLRTLAEVLSSGDPPADSKAFWKEIFSRLCPEYADKPYNEQLTACFKEKCLTCSRVNSLLQFNWKPKNETPAEEHIPKSVETVKDTSTLSDVASSKNDNENEKLQALCKSSTVTHSKSDKSSSCQLSSKTVSCPKDSKTSSPATSDNQIAKEDYLHKPELEKEKLEQSTGNSITSASTEEQSMSLDEVAEKAVQALIASAALKNPEANSSPEPTYLFDKSQQAKRVLNQSIVCAEVLKATHSLSQEIASDKLDSVNLETFQEVGDKSQQTCHTSPSVIAKPSCHVPSLRKEAVVEDMKQAAEDINMDPNLQPPQAKSGITEIQSNRRMVDINGVLYEMLDDSLQLQDGNVVYVVSENS